MRIVVCGGRDFTDDEFLSTFLDEFSCSVEKIEQLAHGACRGADVLSGKWASLRGIDVVEFPADWKKYGKSAGFLRNKQMLEEFKPDLVIAFPGGNGTKNTISLCKDMNIRVIKATKLNSKLSNFFVRKK